MTAPLPVSGQRLDKWLWCARFFKTRSLATRAIADHGVRINGRRVTKPASGVRPGDVLTFAAGSGIVTVRLIALANRRGPAVEARTLFEDLTPPMPPDTAHSTVEGAPSGARPTGARPTGAGRPTKRDRRALDRMRGAIG